MFVNRSRTGVGGSLAHGRFPPGHVVQLRPAFGTSSELRTRQLVPPTSSVTNSWSLLIAPREDGQCTKTNLVDVSIPLDWKWCHCVEKVVPICTRISRKLAFCLFPTTTSGQNERKRVNPSTIKTSLCTKLDVLALSIVRVVNVRPSTNASRAGSGARTKASSDTRKALVGQPIIWRCLVEPAKDLLAPASEAPVHSVSLCSLRRYGQSHSTKWSWSHCRTLGP